MRKHILLSSIIASSALAVTAYGQIINGSFADGFNGWNITGSAAIIPTRPFDPVTVSGLGNATVVNGNTALISTNPGAPLTVTRLSQTFAVPGRAAVRAQFGDVGRLRLSNFRGHNPAIQLAFNYQFLTNEAVNAVFDFSQIKLGDTQLVFNTPANTAPPGAFGFANATPVQLVTTDISALQGKNTTLSFTVADTIDAIVDSGIAIWDVKILPYVLEDIDAIAGIYSSGLPMALAQRGILLNTVQTANRDVNARLFRLRSEIGAVGAAGPTGLHGLSKDAKDHKKVIIAPEEPRWEVFAGGTYGNRDVESIGPTAGFTTDLYSGTLGVEYALCPQGHLHVGLAATYLEADNDIGLGVGDVEIEGYSFSAYASYTKDAFYADLLYSFGTFHHNIARPTGLGATATAQPDSRSHSVQFNTGYNLQYGSFVTGPIASLDYINGSIDGYKEDRGGSAGIKVGEQNLDSLVSRIGWQVSLPTKTGFGLLTPQVRAAWVHEYMNEEKQITAKLNNSPFYLVNGGSISRIGSFSATGNSAEPGDDYLSLGGGLSLQITDRASVILDYEARLLQADSSGQAVSLTGSVKF